MTRLNVTGVKVTSCAPVDDRCIVQLLSDTELSGLAIGPSGVEGCIERIVKDVLTGADPAGVTGLWERLLIAASSRVGVPYEAIAVLDLALWDLKAKADAQPLWRALGGARPDAVAHAGNPPESLSDDELAGWHARMARELGLGGAKLRLSEDRERDLRRLARMHAALLEATSAPVLAVEADPSWPPKQAIRRMREIEEQLDVTWVERAAPGWNFPALKQISGAIRAAVSVGEGLATRGEFLAHFRDRSADVIQLDIGLTGITGALQLADAAFGYELPVILAASPGNVHAHLSSVLPAFMSLEIEDSIPGAGPYASEVRIERGRAVAGDAPGNGLTLETGARG